MASSNLSQVNKKNISLTFAPNYKPKSAGAYQRALDRWFVKGTPFEGFSIGDGFENFKVESFSKSEDNPNAKHFDAYCSVHGETLTENLQKFSDKLDDAVAEERKNNPEASKMSVEKPFFNADKNRVSFRVYDDHKNIVQIIGQNADGSAATKAITTAQVNRLVNDEKKDVFLWGEIKMNPFTANSKRPAATLTQVIMIVRNPPKLMLNSAVAPELLEGLVQQDEPETKTEETVSESHKAEEEDDRGIRLGTKRSDTAADYGYGLSAGSGESD